MKGKTHTYSWENGIPKEADKQGYVKLPLAANIHWVNTKSNFKPFMAVSPDANAIFDIYNGQLRRDVSMFPWWNHWPAAQKASDGRYAMDADYAAHSSLSHVTWNPYKLTKNAHTKIMLHGLTSGKAEDLIHVTKSWSKPTTLTLAKTPQYSGGNYDQTERTYQINCLDNTKIYNLNFTLEATDSSPIENACFVIKN